MLQKLDYKGKHYILGDLGDGLDFMDYPVGTIKEGDMTDEFIASHVEICTYYGIPTYIGTNKELIARFDTEEKRQDAEWLENNQDIDMACSQDR